MKGIEVRINTSKGRGRLYGAMLTNGTGTRPTYDKNEYGHGLFVPLLPGRITFYFYITYPGKVAIP